MIRVDDLDHRFVVVHDGPWGIIMERRTLRTINDGLGIEVGTTSDRLLRRQWLVTLGPGTQGASEMMDGRFVEMDLRGGPDSNEDGEQGQ